MLFILSLADPIARLCVVCETPFGNLCQFFVDIKLQWLIQQTTWLYKRPKIYRYSNILVFAHVAN